MTSPKERPRSHRARDSGVLTVERGGQGRQVYALCTLSVLRSSERSSKERILRKE